MFLYDHVTRNKNECAKISSLCFCRIFGAEKNRIGKVEGPGIAKWSKFGRQLWGRIRHVLVFDGVLDMLTAG